ncbi:MAG: ABC transporter substrate-binding protein [Thermoplasmata archaeon]
MKVRLLVVLLAIAFLVGFLGAVPQRAAAQVALPNGPWVDRLVWSEQPDAALALEQIKIQDADFFMFSLQGATQKQDALANPDVLTFGTFGSVNGLLINPNDQVGNEPDNPFVDAELREAMNWLIDRDFLNREVLDGFAVKFVSAFHPKSADHIRELSLIETLESKYVADFLKAKGIIETRMGAMGFTIGPGASDVWEDRFGRTVDLQIIARIEDERLDIGNYVAEQLRAVGFMVTVNPTPSSDAIPLVYGGDPSIGAWHIYTEGWAFTALSAWDDGEIEFFHNCVFEPFCARFGGAGTYSPPQDFDDMATKLANGLYTSLAERQSIIQELLPRALTETNYRMFIQAEQAIFPVSSRVQDVVMDASGGPWTFYTLKSARLVNGQPGVSPTTGVGGELQILNFVAFNDAWNPWTDPGWLYDAIQRRAIGDVGMWFHPTTGLLTDFRVETSIVTAGPAPGNMTVPATAMQWNNERNETTGEIIGPGTAFVPVGTEVTATTMVTTTISNWGKWHNGMDINMDDIVAGIAAANRRAFGDVEAHDSRAAPISTQFFYENTLKGFEVVDDNTLVTYIDFWHVADSEMAGAGFIYMNAEEAPVPWEIQEAALQSIINDDTAIHEVTATLEDKIWLDLGRNPQSIAAVDTAFEALSAVGTIPQGMGPWITPAEAAARYAASQAFRDSHGHWYASNGPFELTSIDGALKQTVMTAFRDGYPFKPDVWDDMKVVEIPDLTFGAFPDILLAGTGATLAFSSAFQGTPTDPDSTGWFVRELASSALVLTGEPIRTGVGQFEVQLLSTETVGFDTGGFELVVVVQGTGGSTVRSFAFTVTSQLDFFGALIDELDNRIAGLSDDTAGLSDSVAGVQGTTNSLSNLLLAVLALAVIAIVVPAVLLFVLLRRMPPGT